VQEHEELVHLLLVLLLHGLESTSVTAHLLCNAVSRSGQVDNIHVIHVKHDCRHQHVEVALGSPDELLIDPGMGTLAATAAFSMRTFAFCFALEWSHALKLQLGALRYSIAR